LCSEAINPRVVFRVKVNGIEAIFGDVEHRVQRGLNMQRVNSETKGRQNKRNTAYK
jgi:hypothetical protein